MLVHIGRIVNKNILGKYAIPAFNTSDLEMTQGIVRAAEAQIAPVIIQTSVGALDYAGIEELVGLIKTAAHEATVPIALHQDHCHDFGLIKKLIELGYSSVMLDASHLEYKDNIKLTKAVVKYAHKRGVWVQAELGRILGNEDWQNVKSGDDLMTDPGQAAKFVADTGWLSSRDSGGPADQKSFKHPEGARGYRTGQSCPKGGKNSAGHAWRVRRAG